MPCLCGDSQCPSCGLAQGTLEGPETDLCENCGALTDNFDEDTRRFFCDDSCKAEWRFGE
jgi:hypothetical protein